jgi:hypothetical protein
MVMERDSHEFGEGSNLRGAVHLYGVEMAWTSLGVFVFQRALLTNISGAKKQHA